jgi:hypothetical protein
MGAGQIWVDVMIRTGIVAILVACVSVACPVERAAAQASSDGTRFAQAAPEDVRLPRRVYRPPTRLRITPYYYQEQGVYPHYYPGPDAVRVCNARYVQEYRPSGTVIVPRMSCYWTRG